MMTPAGWLEQLRDLLCRIYREWGGDCAELGITPTEWVDTVVETYDTQGAPQFDDGFEYQKFMKTLTELELHLGLPENSLPPEDTARLLELIAQLRQAILDINGPDEANP